LTLTRIGRQQLPAFATRDVSPGQRLLRVAYLENKPDFSVSQKKEGLWFASGQVKAQLKTIGELQRTPARGQLEVNTHGRETAPALRNISQLHSSCWQVCSGAGTAFPHLFHILL